MPLPPLSTSETHALDDLIRRAIAENVATEKKLRQLKTAAAGTDGGLPTNAAILRSYRRMVEEGEIAKNPTLARLLVKRKVRSLSGVSVVTVLTRPFGCPGKCTFCPTEVGMPKSYLANQPGAMRALRNEFDPYRQVRERLETLQSCGHPAEKIELIILGGTWTALPRWYQTWFVRRCLIAMNCPPEKGGSREAGGGFDANGERSKKENTSLTSLSLANESAPHRLVGFTVETRPDWLDAEEIAYQRRLGVTRVELGAQSTYDDVLKHTKRGHTTARTIEAVRLLKNAGMKVGLHLMPNLPLSSPERDFAMLREVFETGAYMPDQIKIYPCSVLPNTALERQWRAGTYTPYDDDTLTDLVGRMHALIPEWCRVSRVVRDIPATSILAGAKITNLRQVLQNRGIRARDIHDREIGEGEIEPKNIELVERRYAASDGEEIFLSFEDTKRDKLVAFCRLRLSKGNLASSGRRDDDISPTRTAFIREVHSYGQEVAVGKHDASGQHRGYGRRLIDEAEKLAKKAGYAEVNIPAGVGVRPYYRRLGYILRGTYMAKDL